MPGLEDKLKEIEERINRLENKMKISLFEVEKNISQPKQAEPVDERLLEMEDLILLLQLETTKIKDKLSQEIDIEFTPKTSQSTDDRITRLEEEIGNLRASKTENYDEDQKPRGFERPLSRALERHYNEEFNEIHDRTSRHEEPGERPRHEIRKKKDDEEETVTVRGSVIEDLQKILNK